MSAKTIIYKGMLTPDQLRNYFLDFKNEKYELASMLMGSTDYRVVMVIPQGDLLSIINVIRYNTIWLTVVVFILA